MAILQNANDKRIGQIVFFITSLQGVRGTAGLRYAEKNSDIQPTFNLFQRVGQKVIMKVNLPITVFVVFAALFFAVNDVHAHMHNMMKYASAMSPDGNFQLQWAYNDTGFFYFKMKCKNTGWCGVGFADNAVNSDGRNMANYDIAVGGYNSTGYVRVSCQKFVSTESFLMLHGSETMARCHGALYEKCLPLILSKVSFNEFRSFLHH